MSTYIRGLHTTDAVSTGCVAGAVTFIHPEFRSVFSRVVQRPAPTKEPA